MPVSGVEDLTAAYQTLPLKRENSVVEHIM